MGRPKSIRRVFFSIQLKCREDFTAELFKRELVEFLRGERKKLIELEMGSVKLI